ncbi:MAG TPA: hypothetical protein ENI99_02915 [Sedimenticola sp.]|nr:hypothetical protein [Sedimenticola sp.]
MLKSEKQPGRLTEQQQFLIRLFFQRKEVEEHKYYLSEQKGFDVGLDQSAADWVCSGQAERFARDFSRNEDAIYAFCTFHCGDEKCSLSCRLSMEKIHDLMGD